MSPILFFHIVSGRARHILPTAARLRDASARANHAAAVCATHQPLPPIAASRSASGESQLPMDRS